ncbi:IS66 family insertion sequence element accessory protein TnpA [Pelosinus propionicus]
MDTQKIKQAYRLNQWTEIVRQCRSSGQTVAAFCKEQNLNHYSF